MYLNLRERRLLFQGDILAIHICTDTEEVDGLWLNWTINQSCWCTFWNQSLVDGLLTLRGWDWREFEVTLFSWESSFHLPYTANRLTVQRGGCLSQLLPHSDLQSLPLKYTKCEIWGTSILPSSTISMIEFPSPVWWGKNRLEHLIIIKLIEEARPNIDRATLKAGHRQIGNVMQWENEIRTQSMSDAPCSSAMCSACIQWKCRNQHR